MTNQFRIINSDSEITVEKEWFKNRCLQNFHKDLKETALKFIPGKELETAMNIAIASGDPLLLAGEPGTGKTQAAYYIAKKLDLDDPIHFVVKSTSKAQDLLYTFDMVRYFHDASLHKFSGVSNPKSNCGKNETFPKDSLMKPKEHYIEQGSIWTAITTQEKPKVLLIDEIDKASRDFPNDLLYELDQMKIKVPELKNKTIELEKEELRPIVVITSNSERRLPEPFLRRCIFHYIKYDRQIVENAIKSHKQDYPDLTPEFIEFAIEQFFSLVKRNLRKRPSTAEFIVWLRVISVATKSGSEKAEEIMKLPLHRLPFLQALVKDSNDLRELFRG